MQQICEYDEASCTFFNYISRIVTYGYWSEYARKLAKMLGVVRIEIYLDVPISVGGLASGFAPELELLVYPPGAMIRFDNYTLIARCFTESEARYTFRWVCNRVYTELFKLLLVDDPVPEMLIVSLTILDNETL